MGDGWVGIKELVEADASLRQILEHLRNLDGFTLTPLAFLKVVQAELGISFVRTRNLF